MNIIYHITFNTDGPATKFFEGEGFKIKPGIINTFDITEDHPKWERVKEAVKCYGDYEVRVKEYGAKFTKKEIEEAAYFALLAEWNFEYPQPSEAFGYQETTYRSGIGCRKCGVGLQQYKSFSIKKKPNWGKLDILQLNWVFDEYFVSKEMKDKLEGKISGTRFLEVLKHPQSIVLDDIFQLLVENRVSLVLPENSAFKICDMCKCKKYMPSLLGRGFFPLPFENDFSIAQSQEFFGDGGRAFRITIINRATYLLLTELNIKGVNFYPCA